MPQPSPPQHESVSSDPRLDVDFLAEVLIDRELPAAADIDLTIIDLTVIDLTTTAGKANVSKVDTKGGLYGGDRTVGTRKGGWGLSDDTPVGRHVTPDHVLAARSEYCKVAEGRPLIRSVGTIYQTASGFANGYVVEHVLDGSPTSAEGPSSRIEGDALARAELIKEAQHRVEYFLNLSDDDFFACFRFNGEITGEYLAQVNRCERKLEAERTAAAEAASEPSPRQRRQRKSQSLQSF